MKTEHHTTEEIIKFLRISSEQKRAVKSFWESFDRDQAQLSDHFDGKLKTDIDIPGWVKTHLQLIDQDIMWEFGPGLEKTHRLVITAENNRPLRPLVQYILSLAPVYSNWEFYEYRLTEDLAETKLTMISRTSWHDLSEVEFELRQSEYNKVGITYHVPYALGHEENHNSYNSYVLTESLLGEEILDKWVDYIEVRQRNDGNLTKAPQPSINLLPNLRETFLREIETIKSCLPQNPYFEEIDNGIKWCSMKATPLKQQDSPKKQDLYVASFIQVEGDLFNATYHGYSDFSSERFSNNNEIFLYLKMDGAADDLNQETFIDRFTIEDMLNEELQKHNLGCVIGGGTGLRYSYIDFALVDFSKAIQTIRHILQQGKLTKRSWILFHDAIYQSQWIGVWDDSPLPPI